MASSLSSHAQLSKEHTQLSVHLKAACLNLLKLKKSQNADLAVPIVKVVCKTMNGSLPLAMFFNVADESSII